jgi:hypothetical protein
MHVTGVIWKKTGKHTYKLNHFAWLANGTENAPSGIGNPSGPTRFFEEITLSPDGKYYSGTFTLDAYAIALALTRTIAAMLYGVKPTDVPTFAAVSSGTTDMAMSFALQSN